MNPSQIIVQGIGTEELLEAFRSIVRAEIQAIPKPEKLKPYLSLDEVCDLTQLSRSTIYQYTFGKKIPHIKKSGKLLFNRQEITAWLDAAHQPMEK